MHREPHGGLVGGGALDAMARAGRNLERVAGGEGDDVDLARDGIFEAHHRAAAQEDDPLVLLMIIPESVGRGVPAGDEPHDADVAFAFGEDFDQFPGQSGGDGLEKIGRLHHGGIISEGGPGVYFFRGAKPANSVAASSSMSAFTSVSRHSAGIPAIPWRIPASAPATQPVVSVSSPRLTAWSTAAA